jgi:hypothetical protein
LRHLDRSNRKPFFLSCKDTTRASSKLSSFHSFTTGTGEGLFTRKNK